MAQATLKSKGRGTIFSVACDYDFTFNDSIVLWSVISSPINRSVKKTQIVAETLFGISLA